MNSVFLHSDGARYYNKNEYIYDLQNNTLNKQSLNTPSKINTLMENPFLLRDIELFLKKTPFFQIRKCHYYDTQDSCNARE